VGFEPTTSAGERPQAISGNNLASYSIIIMMMMMIIIIIIIIMTLLESSFGIVTRLLAGRSGVQSSKSLRQSSRPSLETTRLPIQ